MKTKNLFIALVAILMSTTLWAKSDKVVLIVNMHCEACQKKIEKNIPFEKGVKALTVDLKSKTVAVTFDDTKTNVQKIQAGFKKLGYDATLSSEKSSAAVSNIAPNADAKKDCKDKQVAGEAKKCCSEQKAKPCDKAKSDVAGEAKKDCKDKQVTGEAKKCCKESADKKS
ncbi:MAG: heavy-metal-associated domain-containing protein [Paludibacter sp.]|nr:heavy-metal-associated domain-containing protein [Paludibacter sp.]